MSDVKTGSAALIDVFDRRVERRLQRRQFFRNAGGLGLGLHIAQQVVREHGGQISYDYVRPHVVFTVELPADQNRG